MNAGSGVRSARLSGRLGSLQWGLAISFSAFCFGQAMIRLRHLRIPQRIGLVLQGESMLNDATALLIYRA